MNYNIFDRIAPAMPSPSRGTEICKLLLSQASKDMRETLVPMLFPVLGAHISGAEFQYPDRSWKETCGMMANLVRHQLPPGCKDYSDYYLIRYHTEIL